MDVLLILLLAGATFGVCYLLDKGFTKVFRGRPQHRSGLSVRLSRRYGAAGIVLFVLGVAAMLAGAGEAWVLFAGGCVLLVLGAALAVYYLSFGVYYDADTFLVASFGRHSREYRYADIQTQQLFNSYGNTLIELQLADGRTVQLQSGMTGAYAFLDHAFAAWLRQRGLHEADCPFHDAANSRWFPPAED